MPQYTEETLEKAIADVVGGCSVKEAVRRHGIPRSTLRSRLAGVERHHVAAEHLQRLSSDQEKALADWIIVQDSIRAAPSHREIRKVAARMCRVAGDEDDIGKHWIDGFIRHNP